MVTQPVPGFRIRREFDRGGIFPFLPRYRRHLGVCAADFAVYMHRRLPLHSIGDMAVNIQCSCRGHMAYGCERVFTSIPCSSAMVANV